MLHLIQVYTCYWPLKCDPKSMTQGSQPKYCSICYTFNISEYKCLMWHKNIKNWLVTYYAFPFNCNRQLMPSTLRPFLFSVSFKNPSDNWHILISDKTVFSPLILIEVLRFHHLAITPIEFVLNWIHSCVSHHQVTTVCVSKGCKYSIGQSETNCLKVLGLLSIDR